MIFFRHQLGCRQWLAGGAEEFRNPKVQDSHYSFEDGKKAFARDLRSGRVRGLVGAGRSM